MSSSLDFEEDLVRRFLLPQGVGDGSLEKEASATPGPEAPRYIVKSMDFLSSSSNMIKPDEKLVDFDQCFPISSPPQKLLGTPIDFLAPDVAVGLAAGPASDVWALGCCISIYMAIATSGTR